MNDLMTKAEVARRIQMSVKSVERYVARGTLPRPLRLSARCVRWRRSEIETYLARC